MTSPKPSPPPSQCRASENPKEKVVAAEDLLRGQREICIDLEGVRYRLRITRRNKLILQK